MEPDPIDHSPLAPTTTAQQDITLASQRRINLIWERTQATLAIFVVVATLGISAFQVMTGKMEQIPTIFSTGFGMVVGFYFGRTNHSMIGGTGSKPDGYGGR